ncbi:MAG: aspartate aminotransferase family protein [Bacteroidales bacterium]
MISQRQLFLQHVGQTSENPLGLEIENADGVYLFDKQGKKFLDLISGIAVSNLGHNHPEIKKAVHTQVEKHMHLMVYGEYIQSPQVEFAKLLADQLPQNLNSVYFVNSGSEANEGALKLAKRFTQRHEIVAFNNAYHGSTQALMGLMSNTCFNQAFRPLMPGITLLEFNNKEQLNKITENTACVIVEPIQGEAGVVLPENDFLGKIRQRCYETGALLIFDEIQTGFGRTGHLFACQKYGVIPDILTIGKAMGGGMPVGAFVSSKEIMHSLTYNPVLGHITTFGGHPVSCAAALASLKILLSTNLVKEADAKGEFFINKLKHPQIKNIRGTGLFYSIELENSKKVLAFIKLGLQKGLITDWFLHCDYRIRIAPPLIIAKEELNSAAEIILRTLHELKDV